MGYSINPQIVYRKRHLVAELEAGRACRWTMVPDPQLTRQKLAELREILWIASQHAEEFPDLALAHQTFSLSIVAPGVIEAKIKANVSPVAIGASVAAPQVAVHGGVPWGREQSTVGKTTAAEITEAWQAHLPSNDAMNFPQTRLPVEELTALYNWAIERTPRLMLLVGDGHLTVTLRDPDVESIAGWHPPVPEPKPEPEYNI